MKGKIGSSKLTKYQIKGQVEKQVKQKVTPGKKQTVFPAMSMKELKAKYPNADTTARGDVRGIEINAYAPKKVLQQYNDTYNAFDKKFKNSPAYKKGGSVGKPKMKMGGSCGTPKSLGKRK
jgi:hypothetical protein